MPEDTPEQEYPGEQALTEAALAAMLSKIECQAWIAYIVQLCCEEANMENVEFVGHKLIDLLEDHSPRLSWADAIASLHHVLIFMVEQSERDKEKFDLENRLGRN